MALIDGPDRWIYPVEVTSSTQDLRVLEDQDGDGAFESGATVTISPGWYWGHADSSFTLPGLYDAIESAMNSAGLGNTYTITSQTPSGSQVSQSGIRIQGDTYPFKIDGFGTDMPGEWFGWDFGTLGDAESDNLKIDFPRSPHTYWQPWSIFSTKSAAAKDWDQRRLIGQSSQDARNAYQIEYAEPIPTREYTYPWLPAANVRKGKADDADHARNAGIPTGDTGHALYHLWEVASRNREIIIVHNDGDQDLQVDSHQYERGYLRPSARQSFDEMHERVRDAGEFYTVEFTHVIEQSEMPFK